MGELLFYSVYFMAAIAVVIGAVSIIGVGLPFEKRYGKFFVPFMPVLIAAAIALDVFFSGRNVSFYGLVGHELSTGPIGLSLWTLRLMTAAIVVCAIILLVSAILRNDKGVGPGVELIAAFSGFTFFTYVVSGLFGTEPSLTHKTLYPIVIFLAAYTTRNNSLDQYLKFSRNALLIFLILGFILMFTKPSLVLQEGYSGLLPNVHFRLWGLASHANNLGPVSVFCLLLVWWVPYKRLSINLIGIIVASSSFVFAQSKTAWIAGLAAAVVIIFYTLHQKFRNSFSLKSASLALSILFISGCFLCITLWFSLYNHINSVNNVLLSTDISTLTGRSRIWAITIKQWQANPIFGYGPKLWGDTFSYKYGYLGIATNSHNQFIDSLGTAGVIGLFFLLIYIGFIFVYSARLIRQTRGTSLAIFIFFMVRCISEVPFKVANVTTTDFLMHFIFFGALLRATYCETSQPYESRSTIELLSGDCKVI